MQLASWSTDHGGEEGGPGCLNLIHRDHERVFTGGREWQVKHQDGRGFQVNDTGGWLIDLHHAGLFEGEIAQRVEHLDAEFVIAKLGPAPAKMEHQMRSWVHRGELLHRDVPPDPEHGEFPALVEQGIVAEQRQIDPRTQLTRTVRTTSPCRIALTASIPLVT